MALIQPDGLRVGAARVVITAPMGVSLAGYYTDRRAVGLRDELYARAFVIDDGSHRIAVIACDLIGILASTTAGARRLIEQTCGIPGEHVLITATHDHSGPLTHRLRSSSRPGETDDAYLADLERRIASAVQIALHVAAPARLRLTMGDEAGIAFNRRFWMQEGPVRTNPGKRKADVLRPAGPVDTRVWTLTALPAAEGIPTEGTPAIPPHVLPLGVLVNFGLHPAIVGGTVIGGDFPAFLESGVQRLIGSHGNGAAAPAGLGGATADPAAPVVVFANAPCGDINHIDVSHAQRQSGFEEAARVGTILAAEVTKAACRLVTDWEAASSTSLRLRGARRQVELVQRRPTAEQVGWARQAVQGRMSMAPGAGLEVVEAYRIVSLTEEWPGETHTTEVQALAIDDDLAIVGLPGEIFADLGLDLRARSPFRQTLVTGLANDAIGYVPTRQTYDEGGYEPASSRFQPGSGERLVEAALSLLAELRQ